MAAPLDVSPAETQATPEALVEGMAGRRIEGRSLGQIAWMRLRRDRVAMAGAVFIVFLILVAVFGPYLVQNPDTYHPDLLNQTLLSPNGPFGGISLAHPFGVDPQSGRDLLARVVVGSRYSLLIAFLATVLAVVIGVFFGLVAGFFGGWVDTLIARTMDVFLAFPLLVFAIALVGVFPSKAMFLGVSLTGNTSRAGVRRRGPQPRRRGPYILFRELLPNMVGPILVYSTLLIPTNILSRPRRIQPARRRAARCARPDER